MFPQNVRTTIGAMLDIGNFVFFTVFLSLIVPLVITIVVIVVVIWAIRRAMPGGRAAADEALRDRLATGQISPTEFQADEDVLHEQGS